jgi:hypothetical protein
MTLEPYGRIPGEMTSTSLDLRLDLTEEEWIEVGRTLGRGAQGVQWAIGDWINYGVDRGYVPQGKYDLASDLTGMTKEWLYVCAWVARSIQPSDRRAELTFAHHRQIASLKPSIERSALLQVAAETQMSSRDLYTLSNTVVAPTSEPDVASPETSPEVETPSRVLPPVQTGSLIELGPHRLVVGDSTDPEVWAKLFMDQPMASVLWTDPPYGVDYVGKTDEQMTIDSDRVEDLPRLLALAFSHTDRYLLDGSAGYICSGYYNVDTVIDVIRALGWRHSTQLVWIKQRMTLGWGDYKPQHESQFYVLKGSNHRWYGPQNRTTVFGLGATSDGTFGYTIPNPSASRRHPTMKPPKLIFEQLRNSALNGEVVVDPFAGSGSTMIAAEQLGLRAFMIEFSEKYAAEIVDRWEHIEEE